MPNAILFKLNQINKLSMGLQLRKIRCKIIYVFIKSFFKIEIRFINYYLTRCSQSKWLLTIFNDY